MTIEQLKQLSDRANSEWASMTPQASEIAAILRDLIDGLIAERKQADADREKWIENLDGAPF